MKYFSLLAFIFAFVAGCDSVPQNQTNSMDLSFRQIRQSLHGATIPYPNQTPFDSVDYERAAYMTGFKQGWDVAIDQGPGALVSVPQPYRQPELAAQAWKTGYQDGTRSLINLVQAKALESSKSDRSDN